METNVSESQNPLSVAPRKKVLIETWGCQMNVADSEKMLGLLRRENYEVTEQEGEADLILLNTCHIREKAKHKVISRLGVIRELKKQKPGMTVAVTGCVAQAEGAKLLKESPTIDVLVGPGKIDELPRMLRDHASTGQSAVAVGFVKDRAHVHDNDTPAANPTVSGTNDISRYVNIQQGCNNFCTFCVVPFTRGREISRHPDVVVAEAERVVAEGAREITFLGQNVNSYGLDLVEDQRLAASDEGPFVTLLKRLAAIPDLARIRFTTSNPHDFTLALADAFRTHPKLGRYIHLPVQSGHDEVLTRMRRKVTVAEYMERVRWLRDIDPEMALSTDLIVGFPGETEEQFQGTLDLVEKVRFSFIYSFKYSARKGTAAARFQEQVPEKVMDERLARLNDLQNRITMEQVATEIGRERQVLCHYESRKEPGIFYGRTEQFRLVRIAASRDLTGQVVSVRITDGNKTALVGELL